MKRVLCSATRGLQRYANRNFIDCTIWFCDLPIEVDNNMLIGVVCDLPIVFCDMLIEVNNIPIVYVSDKKIRFCDLQIEVYNDLLIGVSVIYPWHLGSANSG